MAASFELGIEEDGHAIERVRNGEVSGGKAEHVGVVVFPGEAGDVRPPSDGGTHFRVLVGGHGHTIGAAADQDAHASFSGHPFCKRVGMIRVIDAGTVWCTVVDDLDAALLQPGDQATLRSPAA